MGPVHPTRPHCPLPSLVHTDHHPGQRTFVLHQPTPALSWPQRGLFSPGGGGGRPKLLISGSWNIPVSVGEGTVFPNWLSPGCRSEGRHWTAFPTPDPTTLASLSGLLWRPHLLTHAQASTPSSSSCSSILGPAQVCSWGGRDTPIHNVFRVQGPNRTHARPAATGGCSLLCP